MSDMKISTANLDTGNNAGFEKNRANVNFEGVFYNPYEAPPPKRHILGSIFSGIGAFAAVPAIVGGPVGIAAALGAGGLGVLGQKMTSKAQPVSGGTVAPVMTYPGLSPTAGSLESAQTLDLVSSRDSSISEALKK